MRGDNALCDCKPEPRSFPFIGFRRGTGARSHELFEHAVQRLGGDARAIVRDPKGNRSGRNGRVDQHPGSGWRVRDGVVQDIRQCLLDQGRIDRDHRQFGGQVQYER